MQIAWEHGEKIENCVRKLLAKSKAKRHAEEMDSVVRMFEETFDAMGHD